VNGELTFTPSIPLWNILRLRADVDSSKNRFKPAFNTGQMKQWQGDSMGFAIEKLLAQLLCNV